ncbi:TonB-dependent receptor [Pontibacter sp. SGAir0037]|nr:TonB-dependent receptor [Pontibacter sp. SGAir0037]
MVVSADGKPAAFTSVTLKGTSYGVLTADKGTFSVTAPAGNYTLVVQAIGAGATEFQVELKPHQQVELPVIRLKQESLQLQDVVVTGQYEPQSARQSVYQVRTISSERIKARGATDIQGVLNNELGVRFAQDLAMGTSNLSLQGISGQNVKVLLDGAPMIGRQGTSNEININQLDVNAIERIEIVEGPMSVVYGADALAGVINIITKKPLSEQLAVSARLHEETIAREYGLDRGIHNQHARVNWQHKGWQLAGSISHNDSKGLMGEQEGRFSQWQWHPKAQWLGDVSASFRNSNVNTWYRLNVLDEEINSLGVFTNGKASDKNFLTKRFMHQAQAEWQLNPKLTFTGVAAYTDFKRRTQGVEVDEATGRVTLSLAPGAQDLSSFRGTTFRGTAQYKLSPAVSLQPGVDINLESGSGDRIKGQPALNDYALFASAEITPVPALSIRPGLRVVHNSVYDAPPAIPSINTKITLGSHLDLRLAYARGFRAPSLRELYFSFHDASHDIIGNTNLKAELSHSFSGSLAWQVQQTSQVQFATTIGGFYNNLSNQITTGRDEANPTYYTYINVDKYKTTGGTWSNTFRTQALEATAGVAYIGRYNMYYEAQEGLDYFTWSPEANLNLTYRLQQWGASLGLFYKYTGKLPAYVLGPEQVYLASTDAYHWADITATKTLTKFLALNAGIKNLLDVTRIASTQLDSGGAHSTGGDRPIGYGRSYFFGLNFQWSK